MKESSVNKLVITVGILLISLVIAVLVFADEIDNYRIVSKAVDTAIAYNYQHQFSYEYSYLNRLDYIHKFKG